MSPHAQASFVNDLVEMAEAYKHLPMVREELRDTQERLNAALNMVQRLEGKLLDRANEIDAKNATIRQLEVARDDAELRFLEADERTTRALDFIKSTFGNAGTLIQALEPKSEPQPQPEVASLPLSEVGLNVPPSNESASGQDATASATTALSSVNTESGERAADPTLSSNVPTQSDHSSVHEHVTETAIATDNGSKQDDGILAKPIEHGPYSGKRYHDHPYYVTLSGWLEGGGTEADYHWRPASGF